MDSRACQAGRHADRYRRCFRNSIPARAQAQEMNGCFLIIDADDTLWENNIYFERAFDEFVEFLDHSHLSPPAIRAVLDEIESVNARIHGYGSLNFGRNMQQAYQHLAERKIDDEQLRAVMEIAERI